jgi:tetratricopeptide (TPR) repeat protein
VDNLLRIIQKRGIHKILFATLAISMLFSNTAFAASMVPYTTYTYDKEGWALESPNAYEPVQEYDGRALGLTSLADASDIFVDSRNRIYIADTGNSRVIILDENFKKILDFKMFTNPALIGTEMAAGGGVINEYGIDQFNGVSGVFVTEDNRLFVADTENSRIVEFDENYEFVRCIYAPESDILGEDYPFKPKTLVVDSANRIYIMNQNENQGIVELNENGEFIGYFGAQSVKRTVFDWLRTLFMTDAQKDRIAKIIPRVYSNISIDGMDFIWLTSNSGDEYSRYAYLTSKAKEDATIKRMNPNGNDVLTRNGVYAPGGDLMDVSSIVDVTIKENGMYTALDDKYNRMFTYNSNGDLLYAFGGTGTQDGVFTLASAIAYFGNDLLVLDKEDDTIIRFARTEYGELLENAITADMNRDFEESIASWTSVLEQNQNYDLAYQGMAKNYLRNGNYNEALENFKTIDDKDGFSKAFRYARSQYVKEHFLLVIILPSIFIALWVLFMKYVKKQNRILYPIGSKHTIKDELFYAFRVIYHPFDGFWEIKKEARGSVRSATIIVILLILTFIYKSMGTGFLFRTVDVEYVNIMNDILNVLIPLILWCVASWGLTTLMSGEGSLKDIYIMTAYSLTPMILLNIPVVIASNFLVQEEVQFMSFFVSLAYVWTIGLIFFGSMVIHDYHFNKNLITMILAIVGMGVIMFLALLFITLSQRIWEFLAGIYDEIILRL